MDGRRSDGIPGDVELALALHPLVRLDLQARFIKHRLQRLQLVHVDGTDDAIVIALTIMSDQTLHGMQDHQHHQHNENGNYAEHEIARPDAHAQGGDNPDRRRGRHPLDPPRIADDRPRPEKTHPADDVRGDPGPVHAGPAHLD